MTQGIDLESMSPQLLKVAERAKREPDGRFHCAGASDRCAGLGPRVYRLREERR